MSTATARPTAWKGLAQALLLYTLICVLCASLLGELLRGVMLGSVVFLLYRFVIVREVFTRHHRRGMLRSRDERYEEALEAFRQSFRAWDRRRWLDDARGLLLASSSRYPFRVLALYNEAFVLYRLGREAEALEVLDAVEQEVPNMVAARRLRQVMEAPVPEDPEGPRGLEGWGEDVLADEAEAS